MKERTRAADLEKLLKQEASAEDCALFACAPRLQQLSARRRADTPRTECAEFWCQKLTTFALVTPSCRPNRSQMVKRATMAQNSRSSMEDRVKRMEEMTGENLSSPLLPQRRIFSLVACW